MAGVSGIRSEPGFREISTHGLGTIADYCLAAIFASTRPDILIMSIDLAREHEYFAKYLENTTDRGRVPGPFIRHRVLAGARG